MTNHFFMHSFKLNLELSEFFYINSDDVGIINDEN